MSPGTTAARYDVPVRVPVDLGLAGLGASPLRATTTLGPFLGIGGEFWVDLYGPAGAHSVYSPGASRPSIVLTAAQLPVFGALAGRYSVAIAGGSVWIRAKDLDADLSDSDYVGFTVSTGSLTFDNAPMVGGERLTSVGPLDATLEVTLTADAAPSGDRCGALGTVTPPSRLKVRWQSGIPTIDLGAGSVAIAGTAIQFTGFTGPVTVEPDLGAVVFGYALDHAALDCAPLSNRIVDVTGSPGISGGWALTLAAPGDPDHPGEAAGAGFYLLSLAPGVRVRWSGSNVAVDLGPAHISVRAGQLTLSSRHASADAAFEQSLSLYALAPDPDAPRLPLTLGFGPADIVFAYVCDSQAGPGVHVAGTARLRLDRPVDVNGSPLTLGPCDIAQFGLADDGTAVNVTVTGLDSAAANKPHTPRRILALRNALLSVAEPILFALRGTIGDQNNVDAGHLALALNPGAWLPTLPDPYVTNAVPGGGRAFEIPGPQGLVIAETSWTVPAKPALAFRGGLGGPSAQPDPSTPDFESRPERNRPGQFPMPTQTDQGSAPRTPSGTKAGLPGAAETTPLHPAERVAMASSSVPWFGSGLRLLDVSTNKDQLGVEIGVTDRVGSTGGPTGSHAYGLAGLDVITPAANLHVIALPQVQWEPVRTLDIDQDIPHLGRFPTPLASASDGGPTRFGVQTERLVPAIPDLACDAALAEFAGGHQLTMVTTLPFGIRALLRLRPDDSPDGLRGADVIERNQPVFAKPALTGGAQLALTAEGGPSGRDDSSYFDGTAYQLTNGVDLETGTPLGISVLGCVNEPNDRVEVFFNKEFGPGGAQPRVPVTRLDICGYGGSTFSDWTDAKAAYAATAKAQFQVMVGRAALEVIKVATVLYPWGVRLTRTVTIERKGGGGVIRRDSGWQANSPGLFDFPAGETGPTPGTPYIVEPGLFQGLFNVRNILPTGGAPVSFPGRNGKQVVLTPKLFDADVRVEGLDGAGTTTALGMLGFLQVEPFGEPLHEDDLAQLIALQGPIGGPIDAAVEVGGSGFRMRATRVEIGSGSASGRPELVGVVRGAPVFHQSGAWSAIRMAGPASATPDADAVGVDQVRGLPVVREGLLLSSDGGRMQVAAGTDYRFADPEDLHQPDTPRNEYAFAQTSPAHVLVFRRPHIDPGTAELRSRSTPCFADIFAQMTGKGAFPAIADAITLPANALVIGPGGGFRLRDAVDITGPRPPLVLASNGADVVQLDYTKARLRTSFDQNSWLLDLTGMELWSDLLGIKRFFGWSQELHAGDAVRPVVDGLSMLMASLIRDPLKFARAFDSPLKLPAVDLGPTNANPSEKKVSLQIDVHEDYPEDPPGVKTPQAKVKLDAGLKGELGWERDPDTATLLTAGGVLLFADVDFICPIGGMWFVIIGGGIEMGAKFKIDQKALPGTTPVKPAEDAPSLQFQLEVEIHIGIGIKTAVFEGSLAVGPDFSIEGGDLKLGFIVQLKAEFDIKITKVEVSGEFKGLFHIGDWSTVDWSGEVEINVEIGFFGVHASFELAETSSI